MAEYASKLIASLENTGNTVLNEFPITFHLKFIDPISVADVLQKVTAHSDTEANLLLRILRIRGFQTVPMINMYLNNEQAPFKEELLIGSLALYGLRRSSQDGGEGMNEVCNVSQFFDFASRLENWSKEYFTITFVPESELPDHADFTFEKIELHLEQRMK